jgi:CheY-like chemotaxis protein
MADDFSHIYRWNRRGRKGQRCKVTARGSEVRHGHPRHEIIEPEELAELGVAFDAWAAVSTPAGGRQDNQQGGGQKTAFADGTGAAINDFYFAMPKVILIVDDEPLIRIQIREILEKEGFAVKEAANVHQALQLLDEDGISAVLTDIEMPGGLNGLDLARMVRAMWPAMPLIVTSGHFLPRPHELPPHTPLLTKPFSPERLVSTVRSAA